MDLSALFNPRTVAVVGASDDSTRMGGGMLLRFMLDHGFAGTIIPVNPKRETVQGLKAYPSLEAVPGPIDLAVFAIPAALIVKSLEAIPRGHVKMGTILTSGFAETGEEGGHLQDRLVAIARAKDIRLIGPNSLGVVNIANGLIANMAQFFDKETLESGPIALISQSGAFGSSLIADADLHGVHFSTFVSSGNEADLEFSDFARAALDDPAIDVVCGYLETIRNGAGFIELAQRALEVKKPVVVLKVGSSAVGAAAARSHTGALVGSDAVANSVFDSFNVIRARDSLELLEVIKVFSRTPTARGTRLGILSHSGGAGVMAADAAIAQGITVPPLPEALHKRLTEMLPAYAVPGNPLDMTGGVSLRGELMAECMRAMLESDAFDAALLCVNLIWRAGDTLVEELTKIAAEVDKPFAVSWVAPKADTYEKLKAAPFPVMNDPARAAHALALKLKFDDRCRTAAVSVQPKRPVDVEAPFDLGRVESQAEALAAYGIRVPKQTLATDRINAVEFLKNLGGTVALKIASPDIAHRTEIGGVVTGVDTEAALNEAYDRILANAKRHHPDARIDGVLVQEMIVGGTEALIGMKRDASFGPMIAVGAGGTLVELLGDVRMAPAPLSAAGADALIERTLLRTLLAGYRGGPVLDRAALADLIVRASWLAADHPNLAEFDLNPVIVLPEGRGAVAVDFKFAAA
ncbi:MAG: acetate--CoA ligase family protein [Rhodospirillales bacterium]